MKNPTKLHILGAGQEVGRSSFLVDAGERVLLDRGIKITPDEPQYPLPVPGNLDAIVVSHAHLDHSGDLPRLFSDGHTLTYMTPATLEVSKILWADALKIADFEGIPPRYSRDDIARVERYTFPLGLNRELSITKRTSLTFFDAGHILGSAISRLSLSNGKTLVYTGDFYGASSRLHYPADIGFGTADYLITESTYGDRDHPDRREAEKMFCASVRETLDNGGHAVVAALAVERSQELIDLLIAHKINAPIYYDGMGQKVANVMLEHPHDIRDGPFLQKALHEVHWVKSPRFRKRALEAPSIIVTTSGMVAGGPVLHYLKKLHMDPKSKLFLTCYQVEGTGGRQLLDTGRIDLDGEIVEPKMQYEKFDFSKHAGKHDLYRTIKKLNPEKVVCVHGDAQVTEQFAQEIKSELGTPAIAPRNGDVLTL